MTIVVNREYFGFNLPQGFCDAYDMGAPFQAEKRISRSDPRLVEWVRKHSSGCRNCSNYGNCHTIGRCTDLTCITIPDACTDYRIRVEEDVEVVDYVLDGKIYKKRPRLRRNRNVI